MLGYLEVVSQADLDQLLIHVAGFHDSMSKEFHIINRGHVKPDHSMVMSHQFDGQMLIQSQWPPHAIELVCSNILDLHVRSPESHWGASGKVVSVGRAIERAIELNFDGAISIVSERLFYADRSDWLGRRAFLGGEVPSVDAVAARSLEGRWRQCSACSDAWEEERRIRFSLCTGCDLLTECICE